MGRKPILLVLAMICGAITATGAGRLGGAADASGPSPTVDILVAARHLRAGEPIAADGLALAPWSPHDLPSGSVSTLSSLEGLVLTKAIPAGTPLDREFLVPAGTQPPARDIAVSTEPDDTVEDLVNPARHNVPSPPHDLPSPSEMNASSLPDRQTTQPANADRALASARIPADFSVVTLLMTELPSQAYALQPGDRVNVSAFFPSSDAWPQACVREVFRGIEVFAVTPSSDRHEAINTSLSLLIPSTEEEAWVLANELGQVRLTLASRNESSSDPKSQTTARDFVRWVVQRQPTRPAALVSAPHPEPAPLKSQGFRMRKLHGSDWTEYEVPTDDRLPFVIGSSRTPPPEPPTTQIPGEGI